MTKMLLIISITMTVVSTQLKTRHQNRMEESTLEHTMYISIEGPYSLFSDNLEAIIDK